MNITSLRTIFASAAAALAIASTANAIGYATNFDTGYSAGNSLSGQDGDHPGTFWDTNDSSGAVNHGQPDFVGQIGAYSTSLSDNWAALGGLTGAIPVVDTTYLFVPVDMSGATRANFTTKFAITGSVSPQTNLDDFGFTFRDATASQLLYVNFTPNLSNPGRLTIRVYDSANAGLNPFSGAGSYDIFANSIYNLAVDVSATGIVNVSLTDSFNVTTAIVTNAVAAGFLPNLLTDVAATWTLFDNTNVDVDGGRQEYGSNSLVFDDYSVIPEPTSALFAIGLTGVTLLRRRNRVA